MGQFVFHHQHQGLCAALCIISTGLDALFGQPVALVLSFEVTILRL